LGRFPISWYFDGVIQLRDALQNELSSLDELCLRSKAVWGYDAAFMAACRDELTLHPAELRTTHLQVAERDGAIVGLAQVRIIGKEADLMKLFVEPAQLKSGVGRLLFEWATAKARRLGAVRMIIEADPGAVAFYERMGARHAGFAPSQSIAGRMLPRLRVELEKAAGRPR
jgi:GNAT superfamily N-acetyltransferase